MVWPVTPEHTPIAEIKMKLVDTSAFVIPMTGETVVLYMCMTQKTTEPSLKLNHKLGIA
jgi:hypothetical protein